MAFKGPRWTLANLLPVIFVILILSTVWFVHGWLHLLPLLQLGARPAELDETARRRGIVHAAISQPLVALLVACFARAICTDPGSVPNSPEWQADYQGPTLATATRGQGSLRSSEAEPLLAPTVRELKLSGARRFCKWCDSYKPDRCHHCRVCKSCVLRMDHHCPWIANCVGFRNHKYFFLLVFYASSSCFVVVATIWESLARSVVEEMPSLDRFLLVFGTTLATIMGTLLGLFFSLHVWLMMHATTTIEFCEKRHRQGAAHGSKPPSYDRGTFENIRAVLGPNPLLWLLPLSPPLGDGLSFPLGGEVVLSAAARSILKARAASAAAIPEDLPSEPEMVRSLAPGQKEAAAPEVTGERAAAA